MEVDPPEEEEQQQAENHVNGVEMDETWSEEEEVAMDNQ